MTARLAAGDRDVFAEIYQRYGQLLLAMAYNRLKNWQAAEDVVHDVFASLWHNRRQVVIHSLKTYLATAVKYRVLKEARKILLQRKYRQSGHHEMQPLVQESETAYDNRRILQLLQQEIESLPEKCRLIFRYSREQGLSVKQIAREMDISTSTVENQLNKALKRLRGTLQRNLLLLSLLWWL